MAVKGQMRLKMAAKGQMETLKMAARAPPWNGRQRLAGVAPRWPPGGPTHGPLPWARSQDGGAQDGRRGQWVAMETLDWLDHGDVTTSVVMSEAAAMLDAVMSEAAAILNL